MEMYPVQCLRQKDRVNVKDRYAAANVAVDALLTRRGIAVGDLGARMMRGRRTCIGNTDKAIDDRRQLERRGPTSGVLARKSVTGGAVWAPVPRGVRML